MLNAVLSDRLLLFHLSFEPNDVETLYDYKNSTYYKTLMNIYMITKALWNQQRSFILPPAMLRELIRVNGIFETYDEALYWVRHYEMLE